MEPRSSVNTDYTVLMSRIRESEIRIEKANSRIQFLLAENRRLQCINSGFTPIEDSLIRKASLALYRSVVWKRRFLKVLYLAKKYRAQLISLTHG
jgi:hypothetical protein